MPDACDRPVSPEERLRRENDRLRSWLRLIEATTDHESGYYALHGYDAPTVEEIERDRRFPEHAHPAALSTPAGPRGCTCGDGSAEDDRAEVLRCPVHGIGPMYAARSSREEADGTTPRDDSLIPARQYMCSEGGRQWVEDVVLRPFGYVMADAAPSSREEAVEAPCFNCGGDRVNPDDPKTPCPACSSRPSEEAVEATVAQALTTEAAIDAAADALATRLVDPKFGPTHYQLKMRERDRARTAIEAAIAFARSQA